MAPSPRVSFLGAICGLVLALSSSPLGAARDGREPAAASNAAPAAASPELEQLASLERGIAADPENLRLAADYRQLLIGRHDFGRAADFLERLAKRTDSGPNVYISLALAYVDRVPTASDIRRLYLGRDGINALSKAIDRRPSVLAYYVRGLINLYYNNFIFKRIPRGIADLGQALALVDANTPPFLIARVYQSLGDGHWRIEERARAREVWRTGLAKEPADSALRARVEGRDDQVADIVSAALYAPNRVDTSLRGVVP